MRRWIVIGLLTVFWTVSSDFSYADTAVELQNIKTLMEKMQSQMQLMQQTIQEQNSKIQQLESRMISDKPVSETVFKTAAAGESYPWLEGLTPKGDVRLRYESFSREDEDAADRNRFRFRVRWGLEKEFNDEWKAGFRIATGSGTDEATSTNQTFDGEFGLKDLFIDRAYGIYTPTKHWKEAIPTVNYVEIGGGKVANPYIDKHNNWASSIIWDGDVNPEGLYERVDFRVMENDKYNWWDFNFLFGQFVVDEDSDLSPGDHELFAYGVGTTFEWAKKHNFTFKTTYYDWQDYETFIKSGSGLANNRGGNDREVDHFRILNAYAELNFIGWTPFWGEQPWKVFGDYANNLGLQSSGEGDETLKDVGLTDDEDTAFSVGVKMMSAKEPGTWDVGYEYYYIEPNSVVGNFAESDLGNGGANNKGHKLSFKYKILKDLELNFTAWIAERINKTINTTGASKVNGDDDQIIRTQLDLVYKF